MNMEEKENIIIDDIDPNEEIIMSIEEFENFRQKLQEQIIKQNEDTIEKADIKNIENEQKLNKNIDELNVLINDNIELVLVIQDIVKYKQRKIQEEKEKEYLEILKRKTNKNRKKNFLNEQLYKLINLDIYKCYNNNN